MAGPVLLFVSARLQAVVAAMLCLAALQLALAAGASASPGPATGVRMALRP